MPIYEYQCESCGHQVEVIQKMSDAPLIKCPSCGQPALRKLVSAAGFRLSGSGWYETDFKKTGKRNLVEKESKEPAKPKDSAKSGDSKASDSGKSKQSSSTSNSKPAASGT